METVPGITAMQDLAARSGAVLTEGTEPLTLVPVTAGAQALKDALAGPGTVVAYKFGRQAQEVAEALRETGRIDDAVGVGARAAGGVRAARRRPGRRPASLPLHAHRARPA